MDVAQYAIELAEQMKKELPFDNVGCKDFTTYGKLAEMIQLSGDGDYLEVGTWRGASAIIVAMVKREFTIGGGVYCVDNFNGYNNHFIGTTDAIRNFDKYGVKDFINITIADSRPFPIKDKSFVCAFIDANHWEEEPYLDFVEIESMVEKYILMDDYDHQSKHKVIENVNRILDEFSNWKLKEAGSSYALLERIR